MSLDSAFVQAAEEYRQERDRKERLNRQPQRSPDAFVPGVKRKLQTFTASALQGMEFPPIKWIVPDLIPEGLTILAGPPKLGKSWMVLDMGCAVAEGGETLGKECEQGDVLYLALEDNRRRLKSRVRKLLTDDEWPASLTLSTQCPRLDQGGTEAIAEWIDNADNPRLVAIDTLAMVKPPASKRGSAYDSDVNALKGLHDLASERGLSIIVVTHLRKAEADDPVERINSTMGQSGVADTLVVLSRNPAGGAILYARGRDLQECEHAAELVNCRWQLAGDPIEAGRSATRQAIFKAVVGGADSPKAVHEALKGEVGDKTIRQQLRRMVRAGHLINPSRGKYAPPEGTGVGVSQPSQPSQREGSL